MHEDGQIDYSGYSLRELREAASSIKREAYPLNYANLVERMCELGQEPATSTDVQDDPFDALPTVDVSHPDHVPPKIPWYAFGARCPACGWRKPFFGNNQVQFGTAFPCGDCHSMLNYSKLRRVFNGIVAAITIPSLAYFSFGPLSDRTEWTIIAVVCVVAVFDVWFMRLQVVEKPASS